MHLSAPLPNRELAAPRTAGDYDVTEMGVSAVPWWWSKTASQDTQDHRPGVVSERVPHGGRLSDRAFL